MISKKKRGSIAILIIVIFMAMIIGISAMYEAASRRAAESLAELTYRNAGRVVLSCYDKDLQERYSIFAFEKNDEKLEKTLRYLTDETFSSSLWADVQNVDVSVEKSGFSIDIPDNLKLEIRTMMKTRILADGIKDLWNLFNEAKGGFDTDTDLAGRIETLEEEREAAKEAQAEASYSEEGAGDDTDYGKLTDVHDMLKAVASGATEEEADEGEDTVLKNRKIIKALPSTKALGGLSSAFTGDGDTFGEKSESSQKLLDNILITAYIMDYFGNHLSAKENTFFDNEVEYILYGNLSDKKNYKHAHRSIMSMRVAANIAYLYSDSEKRTATLSAAELMTPGPFAVLTQLLIISAWGSVEARNDMKNLEAGNAVPLVKTDSTWMTDLDSVLTNGIPSGYIPIESSSTMTYPYYLRLLLMTEDNDEKLYRIMDLIQINMKGSTREEFLMADHFTGFTLSADVKKQSHGVGIPSATAHISMTHAYISEGSQ